MALADEGFAAYAVRGEGLSSEVEDLVMHSVVTCKHEASTTAAKSITHREGLSEAVTIFLS